MAIFIRIPKMGCKICVHEPTTELNRLVSGTYGYADNVQELDLDHVHIEIGGFLSSEEGLIRYVLAHVLLHRK